MGCRIVYLAATGDDDGPDIKCEILLHIIKFDGICRAEFFTRPAFTLLKINAVFRINSVL